MGRTNFFVFILVAAVFGLASCSTSMGNGPQPSTRASVLANDAANRALSTSTSYSNVTKRGPFIIVLPGEFKSTNVNMGHTSTNNIADYGELELSRANFVVLERSRLGALLQELETAYKVGDADAARKILQRGGLMTTQWVAKFDILKFEPVAETEKGVNLSVLGSSNSASSVWIVGMRYTIINANTTQQVATGYFEEKMESGTSSGAFLGVSGSQKGQLTLDSMSHRLIQRAVIDIDRNYK